VTDKKALAEYLFKTSTDFAEGQPWYKDLSNEQRIVHRLSQRVNVDCHNEYQANLIRKLAGVPSFNLSHVGYNKTASYEVSKDRHDVPKGVLLWRLGTNGYSTEHFHAIGEVNTEVRGSLYRGNGTSELSCINLASKDTLDYTHMWFWGVPSLDQIERSLELALKTELETLESYYTLSMGGTE
jgi:hypothetical protein